MPTANGTRITVHDLAPGEYGVSVFHDANDNGQLDLNAIGIPMERYGHSNNMRLRRRADFSDVKFELADDDVNLTIEMQ